MTTPYIAQPYKETLDLVSGTNTGDQDLSGYLTSVKTINGNSIVGTGNLTIAGGGGGTYTHNQIVSSDLWTIAHSMGKYPSVSVVDSGETVVVGDVHYVDDNNLTITFSAAFGGKAYLN